MMWNMLRINKEIFLLKFLKDIYISEYVELFIVGVFVNNKVIWDENFF